MFVDTGILKHCRKDKSDFLFQDGIDIVLVEIRISADDIPCPCRMACGQRIGIEIFVIDDLAGNTARPMTSIRPMFSFLI